MSLPIQYWLKAGWSPMLQTCTFNCTKINYKKNVNKKPNSVKLEDFVDINILSNLIGCLSENKILSIFTNAMKNGHFFELAETKSKQEVWILFALSK